MFPKSLSYNYRAQRSSALVITLAAVVLVSAIILVFFGQSTLNRQMSYASAGQDRADLVAHLALDTIVGDLRSEIAAGSLVTTSSGTNIYVPTANTTVVPSLVLGVGGNLVFVNLIKQSASGLPFWPATTSYNNTSGPNRSAGNNSSTNASWNGRAIPLAEWNRPGLLGDPDPNNNYPASPSSPYHPPDWVIITRQGPAPVAGGVPFQSSNPNSGTLSDKSPGNMNYAVGRYAYTIYDEGGLLDVNVAGFPSSLSGSAFASKRGMLPQVDLGNIPGVSNANALVQWRNASSAAANTTYTNYVMGNTNGFTTVANGDQTFISRQDLIKYALANPGTVSSGALQYLGTFSRELNAPSYTPSSTLPAADLTSQNPSLINTRVTISFTRPSDTSDGTTAQVGEPLIKYRFPLSRLNWIGHTGPTGTTVTGAPVTGTDILNAFGLSYAGNGVWNYVHGSGNPITIMSLSAVVAAGREPDFFELLQAGILAGSLGQTATNPYSNVSANDQISSLQILQIGANLIDQYDSTDSYPTRIKLAGGTEVDGIQNLPYLVSVYATPYQIPPPTGSAPGTAGTIGMWFQPEVWNPHGQTPTIAAFTTQPPFRFVASGAVQTTFSSPGSTTTTFNFSTPPSLPEIDFPIIASTFSEPTLLSPTNASAPGSTTTQPDQETSSNANFLGLALGTPISDPAAPNSYTSVTLTTSPSLVFQLQYWDVTTTPPQWVTYSQMRSVIVPTTAPLTWTDPLGFATYSPSVCITRSDPRTDRFGVVTSSTTPINTTLWPVPSAAAYATSGYTTSGLTTWSGTGSVGTLSDNKTSSSIYYTDPDSTVIPPLTPTPRPADGAYSDGTAADGGYPLATGAATSRPYILHRPFQSVAEMGYAFRDEPWKHLDFFTSSSADAALLDLFCVNTPLYASPTAASSAALPEAGRVDLNTRQTTVLQAVLQGALMAEDDFTPLNNPVTLTTGSSGEATTLSANLVALTSAKPLLNRSELVTRWISAVPTSTPPFDSNADAIIKRRREAAVRALADVGNTRTWNLLIDVIAQSGRYAPTAANYNQFIVEGERRYWLHVAIDRYTNEVVAQYLEPVYQ